MPVENPPQIYRTPDNTEWTFVQTFADYGQLQKFRRKSHCKISTGRESHRRVRFLCKRFNCDFQLLALKNTSAGYHVYKTDEHEHTHPVVKPRSEII
jgi:hypothetical protein